MAEVKTRPTRASVKKFIDAIGDATTRQDCKALVKMMKGVSGEDPKMWGPSIIGFGMYSCRYASGRELVWPRIAFSPRKNSISLYGIAGAMDKGAAWKSLGNFKRGKGCVYIKRLSDVDQGRLAKILSAGFREHR